MPRSIYNQLPKFNVSHAVNADSATHADLATNALTADHALTADYALNAAIDENVSVINTPDTIVKRSNSGIINVSTVIVTGIDGGIDTDDAILNIGTQNQTSSTSAPLR